MLYAPILFNHVQGNSNVDAQIPRDCYQPKRTAPSLYRLSGFSMDVLQRAGLDTWPKEGCEPGPTSFHIVSFFARNGSDQVQQQPPRSDPRKLSEGHLKERIAECGFPRDAKKMLRPQPPCGGNEWHELLADAGLLSPKPKRTLATLNIVYVHNKNNSVEGMSAKTLLDLFAIFGLDKSFLPLLCRFSDTWLYTRRNDGTCSFLLIIQQLYCIAYSFSPLIW